MYFVGESLQNIQLKQDHIEITLTGNKLLLHLLTFICIIMIVVVLIVFKRYYYISFWIINF